ncbi:MAG: PAS domain S-box protein [Nocardioidaceae bacterium]|nr:PAS domain S-box protein [Nocardioidaceae bacterium]
MTVTGSTPTGAAHDLVVDADLLAQVVEVSADAIFSEDLDGRILTWNAAAERLYGCAATDMVGRLGWSAIQPA